MPLKVCGISRDGGMDGYETPAGVVVIAVKSCQFRGGLKKRAKYRMVRIARRRIMPA
jgi:hypothetical protein